jgi:hypothetical protein
VGDDLRDNRVATYRTGWDGSGPRAAGLGSTFACWTRLTRKRSPAQGRRRRRRAISVPLTPVKTGVLWSLADSQLRSSGHMRALEGTDSQADGARIKACFLRRRGCIPRHWDASRAGTRPRGLRRCRRSPSCRRPLLPRRWPARARARRRPRRSSTCPRGRLPHPTRSRRGRTSGLESRTPIGNSRITANYQTLNYGGSPRADRAWPLAWPSPSGPLGRQRSPALKGGS